MANEMQGDLTYFAHHRFESGSVYEHAQTVIDQSLKTGGGAFMNTSCLSPRLGGGRRDTLKPP